MTLSFEVLGSFVLFDAQYVLRYTTIMIVVYVCVLVKCVYMHVHTYICIYKSITYTYIYVYIRKYEDAYTHSAAKIARPETCPYIARIYNAYVWQVLCYLHRDSAGWTPVQSKEGVLVEISIRVSTCMHACMHVCLYERSSRIIVCVYVCMYVY